MLTYQLAQLNCAVPLYGPDDPRFSGFVDNLDLINNLGDAQPGWVWRMKGEANDAMDMRLDEAPDYLFNISVWENVEALHAFVFRTQHVEFFKQRELWFKKLDQPSTVLWWVKAGHRPDIPEAWAKLQTLRRHGPTSQAFTFQKRFSMPSPTSAI